MTNPRLEAILRLIDAANAEDPHRETWQGTSHPKELLYGQRMSAQLERLRPQPAEELAIAARGQHICRWELPRDRYPEGREGYLRWRTTLYDFHATRLAELMAKADYPPEGIARVGTLVRKRGLRTDPDVQLIEDTACLVFLEHYFPAFAAGQEPDKLAGIVRKTWNKMSPMAREAALKIDFPPAIAELLARTLTPA